MTLTLLTAYNAPYLAALTFVLLTGIAELIALLCGHSLSSAMDTPDLPEGLTGEALDWLNIGRIPPADRPLYAGRFFWYIRHSPAGSYYSSAAGSCSEHSPCTTLPAADMSSRTPHRQTDCPLVTP
ncbi:trucated inner membrane protein YqiJ [Escherichia coli O104:H4 str. 01-09591]|nr:trucated inner membrane protein YqiJ [Escherichia coli O104:H4 str. 01-09591]